MADLSEQQVMMADSLAGGRQESDERQRSETREFMQALFRHVSEEDQLLLTLKEVEGLSLRELEQVYGVNENALKVRLFRARQRVLKAYKAAIANGKL
jgi:RNA polymerase sigma-70 factor (ECF subfamily)